MKLKEKIRISIPSALSRFGLFAVIIVAILFSGCNLNCVSGEGEIVEDERKLDAFKTIVLNVSVDLFIVQNANFPQLMVKAEQNIIDLFNIGVVGDELRIDMDGCYDSDARPEIYLVTNRIEGITINGSGDVISQSPLFGSRIELNVRGSGDMRLESTHQFIRVSIKGSGDVNLSGKTDRFEGEVKGSGDIKGANMQAKSASISIKGSGDCFIHASEYLEASIKGSGDLVYSGNPGTKEINVAGSGTVKDRN
jgi:hypothetical protein